MKSPKKKVVITDFSMVTSLGTHRPEFEKNLFAGKSGIKTLSLRPEDKGFPVKAMGLIDLEQIDIIEGWNDPDGYVGVNQFLVHCFNDFQNKFLNPEGIIIGADAVDYSPENLRRHLAHGASGKKLQPLEIQSGAYFLRDYMASLGNRYIENEHIFTINTTCTSGLVALGMAKRLIEAGVYKRLLVGGTERVPFHNYVYPLIALGALSTNQGEPTEISKPFDKDRDGFVKGEGAALFLVESEEAWADSQRPVHAWLQGFDQTSDAYRLTDGRDDGSQAAGAIRGAIANAALKPSDISCISAHGTSTKLNDLHESTAMRNVFGSDLPKIPITAMKSQIGHATAASAALQVAGALSMLAKNQVPPVLNLKETDCGEDLNLVRGHSLEHSLQNVCCNAFGFGGHNACLILSKYSL